MIRVLHTLGGCGGTLLSRCLGVLPAVALLSEINPAAVNLYPHFRPLYQNERWLQLLSEQDEERFRDIDLCQEENFRELIATFYQRANEMERILLLRDFSYIDFIGVPFLSQISRRLRIYEALPKGIPIRAVAFIRHPIDQWRSLCKHKELLPDLTPSLVCEGYSTFLQALGTVAVFKYEEFVGDPLAQMRRICHELVLPFDSSFVDRFYTFDRLTGDYTRIREQEISLPTHSTICKTDLEQFYSNEHFWKIVSATGYASNL